MPPGEEAVLLWLKQDYYVPQGTLHPKWFNLTGEAIFLPGCATYNIDHLVDGNWLDMGPVIMCAWEGIAKKIEAGEGLAAETANVPGTFSLVGTYRLRGTYYLGCTEGEPISAAQCTGSAEVLREFTTGPPPP